MRFEFYFGLRLLCTAVPNAVKFRLFRYSRLVTAMKFWISLLGVLLFSFVASAQTTRITILDSNGNQATGTVRNGNVYFNDSKGNSAFGTIRNGNVFLNGSNGETTFGTIRNGNVFLTDNKGVTTGSIRNGNIFLSNSDGSTTTGTYNRTTGTMYTSTTGGPTQTVPPPQPQIDLERQRQIQQENFDAGYAVGTAVGNVIGVVIERRREKKFCQKSPDRCQNGHVIQVVAAHQNPYTAQIEWMHGDMKRMMEESRQQIAEHPHPDIDAPYWKTAVTSLCSAFPSDTYTDLDGTVKSCKSSH